MIKVYVMSTCPDCFKVKSQLQDNPYFQLVDLGEHVHNLKEFIRLRDNNPVFDPIKEKGYLGIPCFVLEDGTISFSTEEFLIDDKTDGPVCGIDGKGC